ncbi:MAG: DUF559 domain-containing protein [Candidatus Zixiibacteriota bacterium]
MFTNEESPQPPFGHLLPRGEKGEIEQGSGITAEQAEDAKADTSNFPSPFQGEGGPKDRMRVRSKSIRNLHLTKRARSLRRHQTPAESALWRQLRDRRLSGYKFRRQYPAGSFVLDFYCSKARLAIELDGSGHTKNGQPDYDKSRTSTLAGHGIEVVRVWNDELQQNPQGVVTMLLAQLARRGAEPDGGSRGE